MIKSRIIYVSLYYNRKNATYNASISRGHKVRHYDDITLSSANRLESAINIFGSSKKFRWFSDNSYGWYTDIKNSWIL